jgi:hypothetical protein
MAGPPFRCLLLNVFLPLLILTDVSVLGSQTFDAPARSLAQKILTVMQTRGPVALSLRNSSALTSAETAAVRSAIERELRGQGVAIMEPGSKGIEVEVTIAESLSHYLWVAEIRRDESRDVVMEEVARPQPAKSVLPISIEKRPVIEQDHPIFDIRLLEPDAGHMPRMLVLDSLGLSLYEDAGAGWKQTQTVAIQSSKPWPRDLRGYLSSSRDSYSAYVPGLVCSGVLRPALSMQCKGEGPWPFDSPAHQIVRADFVSTRNFFSGRLASDNGLQKKLPAFFTMAGVADRGHAVWIFAGMDGRTRLYSGDLEAMGSWAGWGSDMAAIESQCGSRSQVLVTQPGDASAADSVQAYEMLDASPQPVGDAVAFPGPVTALWTAGGNTAFAIAQDLRTRGYVAYSLAVACNR